jgi:hypothetical protein
MEGRHLKRPAADQIPVERFQMAQIEDISMPFRNRTIVQRAGNQQAE